MMRKKAVRKNIERINPIKRAKVEKGLGFVEECISSYGQVIDKVIIFGSAVTDSCTEESDIDVCLVSDYTASNDGFFKVYGGLARAMGDSCDVLSYRNMGKTLRGEVAEKGVTVYEYSPH